MKSLEKLERLLLKRKITRREFLARMTASGLALTASPLFWGSQARAAVPKKGGQLRFGSTGGHSSGTLDPTIAVGIMSGGYIAFGQLRNNLVEIDHNNQAVPELAESWEPTPDAKRWVFRLRKGVEFHNGKTMDAEDVITSLNRHKAKDSKSAAKSLVMQIKEMKADGKNTVIFDLESGSADFPYVLSDYNLNITPPDTADILKGIGTGGYKLVDYEPGVRAFTKRNPNYWKEGRAHFDEIETIHIADATARNTALITGEVDLIDKCDMKTYDRLIKKPGIQGIEPIGLRHYNFAMLTDRPPFDNNDARLAMKYVIDRKQILKQVYRNHGTVGNDHPISSIMRFFNSELPQRVYDPEKAKYHLKKAGLQGHTFKLHLSEVTFPGALDAGAIFKESAAKADIRIDLVREPSDGFWSKVWQKVPFSGASWLGRPTEDMMFALVYADGASWNDTHWKHERFNKLLKEARAELDEEKRRSMYWEMQKIVRDEGGEIVTVFITEPDAASDKLKFENLAGNMALDGMRCFERWWFAA